MILTPAHLAGERHESTGPDTGRKPWIAFALALSLVLHLGAALVVIFAFSSGRNTKVPGSITIQEVDLSPSLSAAAKTPPPQPPSPAMAEPDAAPKDGMPEQPAGTEQPASAQHIEQARVFQTTPLGLGMAHGYFTGLANGVSLRDDVRDYYFEMVGKINEEWWSRSGALTDSLRQDGVVELVITRNGTLVSIRILQGTGSREADRLLTESIRNTRLAPLPPTYELDLFSMPLRIKAPSSLFRLGS